MHRSWKCPRLDPLRRSKADEDFVKMSKVAEERLGANHPEWTRALVPMMSLAREGGGEKAKSDRRLRHLNG